MLMTAPWTAWCTPRLMALAVLAASAASACGQVPIVREGPAQQRVVARTYAASPAVVRDKLLASFRDTSGPRTGPFRQMTAAALVPPLFAADWVLGFIDPGGYLEPYRQLPSELRISDVLVQDPISEIYWPSEYRTADRPSEPLQFRCSFILHFAPSDAGGTRVEVYELTPSVWAGQRWAFSRHGIGFGRVRDIRFVEPTVTDRVNVLNLLDEVVR